jgi:hypothetical protein
MSRTRTETQKTSSKPSHSQGRRLGEDATGWRCPQCTFHNTSDQCKMCEQPRPKFSKPAKPKPQAKPYPAAKASPKEEHKSEVYYDPTDGSFNVPIAGIKKYDHKPGKNNIPSKKTEGKKQTTNIVTLDSLKSEKVPEKKLDGKRDLMGMLQDAYSDEPLPCMRKGKNDAKPHK